MDILPILIKLELLGNCNFNQKKLDNPIKNLTSKNKKQNKQNKKFGQWPEQASQKENPND